MPLKSADHEKPEALHPADQTRRPPQNTEAELVCLFLS